MEKEFQTNRGTTTVKYKTSESVNQKVVDKIIRWCEKYNQSSGEDLHQSDEGNIYAPELIADIIDEILEFETEDD